MHKLGSQAGWLSKPRGRVCSLLTTSTIARDLIVPRKKDDVFSKRLSKATFCHSQQRE